MYGNAFIAGYTSGCSFDIKIERSINSNESKNEIKF